MITKSVALAGCLVLSTSAPAFAVGATPLTAATSNASHVGTVAAVGAAGGSFVAAANADHWYGAVAGFLGGVILTAGGVAISLVDPPGGTFFDGHFQLIYPDGLLTPIFSGWMGDWGLNPNLPPPPVNPLEWGTGIEFFIQPPAPGLDVNIDQSQPGVISVAFGWPVGSPSSTSENFNFFATIFQINQDARAIYLGQHSEPPPGANNYVANTLIRCAPPGQNLVSPCGNVSTGFYQITAIPLPPTAILLLTAIIFLAGVRRLRRY